jgi:hypothetical protein
MIAFFFLTLLPNPPPGRPGSNWLPCAVVAIGADPRRSRRRAGAWSGTPRPATAFRHRQSILVREVPDQGAEVRALPVCRWLPIYV